MQNKNLAEDYLKRAAIRLKAVEVLLNYKSYADVVRESQEVVELALKALLGKVFSIALICLEPLCVQRVQLFWALTELSAVSS